MCLCVNGFCNVFVCECVWGFCIVWVCVVCGYCNVWENVYVRSLMKGGVCWVFCNVWLCINFCFLTVVLCVFWILKCVGVCICVFGNMCVAVVVYFWTF